MGRAGLSWLPLAGNNNPLLSGDTLLLLVLLHSTQEILAATGVLHMFNAEIDTLLKNLISA